MTKNMTKKNQINPLSLFGFLGLIGILGIVTEDRLWLCWFSWFSWFEKLHKPTDERFYNNLSKASAIFFPVAVGCFTAVIIMRGLHVAPDTIFAVIGLSFALIVAGFNLLFYCIDQL